MPIRPSTTQAPHQPTNVVSEPVQAPRSAKAVKTEVDAMLPANSAPRARSKRVREELDNNLRAPIIGEIEAKLACVIEQSDAKAAVLAAIERALKGPREKGTLGNYVFTGPTGVGKTLLPNEVAKAIGAKLIKIDCGAFQQSHEAAKFFGAPPGFSGHGQTMPVVHNDLLEESRGTLLPYTVLLFDEFEKAHVDVYKALLGALDEGKTEVFIPVPGEDGKAVAQKVDLTRTICFFSANAAAALIAELGPRESNDLTPETPEEAALKTQIATQVKLELKLPEFAGRIDEVIHFRPLSTKGMNRVLDLELRRVRRETESGGDVLPFRLTRQAREWLLAQRDPELGGRNLSKLVDKHVGTLLTRYTTSKQTKPGDMLVGDVAANGEGLTFSRFQNDAVVSRAYRQWGTAVISRGEVSPFPADETLAPVATVVAPGDDKTFLRLEPALTVSAYRRAFILPDGNFIIRVGDGLDRPRDIHISRDMVIQCASSSGKAHDVVRDLGLTTALDPITTGAVNRRALDGIPRAPVLDEVEAELETVIEQTEAKQVLLTALERTQAGPKEKGTLGNYLFVGPSGVGKTLLATEAAEAIGGQVVRLDGRAFQNEVDLGKLQSMISSKIIDDARGTKVPVTILLLDNWEKVDAAVNTAVLTALEAGKIVGEEEKHNVDLRRAMVIISTNDAASLTKELMAQVDDTAHFRPLSERGLHKALERELRVVRRQIEKTFGAAPFRLSPEASEWLLAQRDATLGGHNISKVVDKYVTPLLTRYLTSGKTTQGDMFVGRVAKDGKGLQFEAFKNDSVKPRRHEQRSIAEVEAPSSNVKDFPETQVYLPVARITGPSESRSGFTFKGTFQTQKQFEAQGAFEAKSYLQAFKRPDGSFVIRAKNKAGEIQDLALSRSSLIECASSEGRTRAIVLELGLVDALVPPLPAGRRVVRDVFVGFNKTEERRKFPLSVREADGGVAGWIPGTPTAVYAVTTGHYKGGFVLDYSTEGSPYEVLVPKEAFDDLPGVLKTILDETGVSAYRHAKGR